VGDQVSSGDWRPTAVVIVALIAFFLATTIPLAQKLLLLDWLRQPTDYLVVGLAVLAWALFLRFIWRLMPLEPTVP
jgi:hypothetical protein